jgi:tellurite methyltransferase
MPNILPSPSAELRSRFGEIDIYLFDQLLKGRFDHRPRVLDAGCGDGRNLTYFLRRGFACSAADREPGAIECTRRLAGTLAPDLPPGNIRMAEIEQLPWDDRSFDFVICSAVLHFASDETEFGRMLQELWRVLAADGVFFSRLASSIGLEDRLPRTRGRVRLPDGSDRFVVDELMLLEWAARLDGRLLEPIKTTNVQHQRSMTTWCLHKPG